MDRRYIGHTWYIRAKAAIIGGRWQGKGLVDPLVGEEVFVAATAAARVGGAWWCHALTQMLLV